MHLKIHHGRLYVRDRIDGRYRTRIALGLPLDLAACRHALNDDDVDTLVAWLSRQRNAVSVRAHLPRSHAQSIAPVYVADVVLAIEATASLAVCMLAQAHVCQHDGRRLRAAIQRMSKAIDDASDADDEIIVVEDDDPPSL
jgi:hypothetical protein